MDGIDPFQIDSENNETQSGFNLDEELVQTFLDDILLMLIAARDGASGKELLGDLRQMGCEFSPGTVYPHLRELADSGVLTAHERVRSKEYRLADQSHLQARVRHLVTETVELQRFLLWQLAAAKDEEHKPIHEKPFSVEDALFALIRGYETSSNQSPMRNGSGGDGNE